MTIFDLDRGAPVSSPEAPLSLALGNFDGVHVGHRELICAAGEYTGAALSVFTFSANPFGTPYITTLDEKLKLFARLGVRYALICDFDEVASLSPAGFTDLLCGLGTVNFVCGFNYTFGAGACGNAETLDQLTRERGAACRIVGRVTLNGETVSSSRIREMLASGDVEGAAEMLGRRFSYTYPVVHGNAVGRLLGYPTINQRVDPGRAALRRGVYACRCLGCPSVTNIGVRPTVCENGELICETHLIGYKGDLYGKEISVEFISFIRDEKRFDSLDKLKAQLKADAAAALEDARSD